MSLSFLRVKDCSGYRPSVGLSAGPVAKACARMSGKPGPQGNAQRHASRKQQYNTANALQKTTDYIDGFEYEQGALNYFGMPEGRVLSTGGALKLEFIMSDQQGNARVSFDNSGTGGIAQVKQENSYYAFGMTYQSITPGNPNLQLYNGGSEWQRDYGDQLPGYYQTFYRNYDAALGRWISVDPEAESTESMTTYQYSMNNPVMFNDPMGNKIPTPGSRGGPSGPAPDEFADNSQYYDDIGGGAPDYDSAPGGGDFSDFWGEVISGLNNWISSNPGQDEHIGQGKVSEAVNNYFITGSIYGNADASTASTGQQSNSGPGEGTTGQGNSYNGVIPASDLRDNGNQGGPKPLSHQEELALYGTIKYGISASVSGSFVSGGTLEFGWLVTDKNYVQYYMTTSYTGGVSAPGTTTVGFWVSPKIAGYLPTFLDWTGLSGSFGAGGYSIAGGKFISNTYKGGYFGVGITFKGLGKISRFFEDLKGFSGTGSLGNTNLLGNPFYMNVAPLQIPDYLYQRWINLYSPHFEYHPSY